jgi:hypothetical protein
MKVNRAAEGLFRVVRVAHATSYPPTRLAPAQPRTENPMKHPQIEKRREDAFTLAVFLALLLVVVL